MPDPIVTPNPTLGGWRPYGGLIVPASLTARFVRPDLGVVIELLVEIADRPIVAALTLHRLGPSSPSISGRTLREIPVDRLVHAALDAASRAVDETDEGVLSVRAKTDADRERLASALAKRGEHRKVERTDEFLDEVARIYIEAEPTGQPVLEVAERIGELRGERIPRNTARGWIAEARRRGRLDRGHVEYCERCNKRTTHAHHVSATLAPIDEFDTVGGGVITATFCADHCPRNCDKEH